MHPKSTYRALNQQNGAAQKVVIAYELPRSSLDELTRQLFNRRTGLSVCSATVRKGLRQAGIKRMLPARKPAERAAVQEGDSAVAAPPSP